MAHVVAVLTYGLLLLVLCCVSGQHDDYLLRWDGGEATGFTHTHHSSTTRLFRSLIKLHQTFGSSLASNPGLPNSCATYEERYEKYSDQNVAQRDFEAGNRANMHSEYAVVMQMHHTAASMKDDLIMATRAVAQEVQETGFHFYILYQVPNKAISEHPEMEETVLTREEMLALLPPDLQGLVIFHDAVEDYKLYYPKIAKHATTATLWGPGQRAPHTAISVFMHRYKRYKFAFVMEYDCRLTSGHWGHFLAAALQQAVAAEGSEVERTLGISSSHAAPTVLPATPERLPDLLAFERIWPSDKWLDSQVMFSETELEEMKAMIYGGSRRMFDKMHELAEAGWSMYIESLLPAIPRLTLEAGKTIVINIPTYRESFHCCSTDANDLYSVFFKAQDSHCLPTMLIHPVKNREAFWPNSTAMAAQAAA